MSDEDFVAAIRRADAEISTAMAAEDLLRRTGCYPDPLPPYMLENTTAEFERVRERASRRLAEDVARLWQSRAH